MLKSTVAAVAAACLAIASGQAAFAQVKSEAEKAAAEAAEAAEEETVKNTFAGLQFGVGLSLTLDSGSNERVTSAQLVNDIVRIDNEDNAIARVMLETHYFFTPDTCLFGLSRDDVCSLLKGKEWGWGPFIAIQPGDGDIIDAIGAGVMLGFRRPGREDSFNIGIGAVVDPNARILGDGIKANQPLPAGETEIRYKEKEQWGVVLITSYTF